MDEQARIESLLLSLGDCDWNAVEFGLEPDFTCEFNTTAAAEDFSLDSDFACDMNTTLAEDDYRSDEEYCQRDSDLIVFDQHEALESCEPSFPPNPIYHHANNAVMQELLEELTRLREECKVRDHQIQRMRAFIVDSEKWSSSISAIVAEHARWIQQQREVEAEA